MAAIQPRIEQLGLMDGCLGAGRSRMSTVDRRPAATLSSRIQRLLAEALVELRS